MERDSEIRLPSESARICRPCQSHKDGYGENRKLAAKTLYNTFCERERKLFTVGRINDPQPKEKVKDVIIATLNQTLSDSYDREIFSYKRDVVFNHIIDQTIVGLVWVV